MSPPACVELPKGYCIKNGFLVVAYTQCNLDYGIYMKVDESRLTLIVVYVDDIIVLSADSDHISEIIDKLNAEYE